MVTQLTGSLAWSQNNTLEVGGGGRLVMEECIFCLRARQSMSWREHSCILWCRATHTEREREWWAEGIKSECILDSECSGTTGLQWAQKSTLHLSLSPCTGYQLQLVSSSRHWCLHIEQPQHPPTSTHYYKSTSPPEAPPTSTHYYESTSLPEVWDLLVSDASWFYHREAQNHSPEHSLSPFLADGMTPPPIRSAGSLSIFKQQLKTHLFQHYLTSS